MLSVLEIIRKTTDFFAAKGIEHARYNAELIIAHALGLGRMQIYLQFERLLSEAELTKIRPLVKRRSLREPLAYVLGETDFCGLHLKCDRRALIPRPETEELVEHCTKELAANASEAGAPARILDLGTGTGCIALALAKALPTAEVTAVDASEETLSLARENALATGLAERVRFLRSDWFSALAGEKPFDLVVSNPPYLTDEETATTLPEVREHEPRSALSSGPEGLDDLRRILREFPPFLAPSGLLALETGIVQHNTLSTLLAEQGFSRVRCLQDLSGRDRFVLARR